MEAAEAYDAIGKSPDAFYTWLRISGYCHGADQFLKAASSEIGNVRKWLDVACGTGVYTRSILQRNPDATVDAFDFNEGMVTYLRQCIADAGEEERTNIFPGDARKPLQQIAGHTYQCIILAGIFENFEKDEDVDRIIENLSPHLERNGLFLHSPVTNDTYGKLIQKCYGGITLRSRQHNFALFQKHGFTVQKVLTLPRLHPASFKEFHIISAGDSADE